MAVWGDFAITGVRYDASHSVINNCHVRKYHDSLLDPPETLSRQTIINSIKAGKTYVTAIKSVLSGKWEIGADVGIVNIERIDYLRTDKNQTSKDNLENLPEI